MAQCSETSIQQKLLPTSVNNVVLFSVIETDPTSVKNVVFFFSHGDRLLNTFNYCIQWNLNPTKTSSHFSEQRVTFFRYGYRSHFSEICSIFFSYGDRLLNPFNYCLQWNLNPKKMSSRFSEQCGTFSQLWRQITQPL